MAGGTCLIHEIHCESAQVIYMGDCSTWTVEKISVKSRVQICGARTRVCSVDNLVDAVVELQEKRSHECERARKSACATIKCWFTSLGLPSRPEIVGLAFRQTLRNTAGDAATGYPESVTRSARGA